MSRMWNTTVILAAVIFWAALLVGLLTDYIAFTQTWMKYLAIVFVTLSALISFWRIVYRARMDRTGAIKVAEEVSARGASYRDEGDIEAAISEFERALRIDPDCEPANRALGQIYLAQGDVKRASEHLKRAVGLVMGGTPTIKPPEDNKLTDNAYYDDEYNFSIRYPRKWRIKTGSSAQDAFVNFFGPWKQAYVNIVAGPTGGIQESLADLENKAIRSIHMNGFQYISLKHVYVDNTEAVEICYERNRGIRSKKIGFVKDGVEYIITCAAVKHKFADYESLFDICVQSMRIEKRMV